MNNNKISKKETVIWISSIIFLGVCVFGLPAFSQYSGEGAYGSVVNFIKRYLSGGTATITANSVTATTANIGTLTANSITMNSNGTNILNSLQVGRNGAGGVAGNFTIADGLNPGSIATGNYAATTKWNSAPYTLSTNTPNTSVTGTTNSTTLDSYTILGNTLKPNSLVEIWSWWTVTNSANNKNIQVLFNNANTISPQAASSASSWQSCLRFWNNGALNSQKIITTMAAQSTSSSGANFTTGSTDFSSNVTVNFNATLANASDNAALNRWSIRVY